MKPDAAVIQKKPRITDAQSWADMDGKRINFRSDHRPRGRFLYFHYINAILKNSYEMTKP